MKRTTVSINQEQRMVLERLAVNATVKIGRTVKWTDIIHKMIDKYADEAVKDIEDEYRKESLKKVE